MKRIALSLLSVWKNKKKRRPLVINGARQVGKTWLMQHFGQTHYQNYAYINFDKNNRMQNLFASDMNIERLIEGLEIESKIKISPHNTLIIFDEIQECPNALSSLKYFYENETQYSIVSAGSLLGVALHKGSSFPVGKVEFMDLHPLCFTEFLEAIGEERLLTMIQKHDFEMMAIFKNDFERLIKTYFYVGGMPDVVKTYVEQRDYLAVREAQKNLLEAYKRDFSKHLGVLEIPKLQMIWNSIPAQLAKENKKFIYGALRSGARSKDFENAMQWLSDCGLIYRIPRITKPGLPLSGYEEHPPAFKLFTVDVGLLCAMTHLTAKVLLEENRIFEEFKGSLTEQYVQQELRQHPDLVTTYYHNRNTEIDFVIQDNDLIIPIEVKATINLQAKSLTSYQDKYKPQIAVRTSLADYKKNGHLCDIPLYAISELPSIIR